MLSTIINITKYYKDLTLFYITILYIYYFKDLIFKKLFSFKRVTISLTYISIIRDYN